MPTHVVLFYVYGTVINLTVAYNREEAEELGKNYGTEYKVMEIDYSARND